MYQNIRDRYFNSTAERSFFSWYRSFFSISEIEESPLLQWALGAVVFSYFFAFDSWFYRTETTIDAVLSGTHSCWAYFQGCGSLFFLRTLPEGYSQPFLYMALFGTLLLSVYAMYKRDWVIAHFVLIPAFFWHIFVVFVLTDALSANYEYYLFLFGLVLLVLPHKEFFLKLTLVLFYFLASTIKLHEGWILGTYFSAMKTGLPLFPEWSTPLWTNLVIFEQIIGAWFLLSRNIIAQRTALAFAIAFHLYSGILVGFRYPSVVLPMVLIAFGPFFRAQPIPFDKKSIAGWILVVLLCMGQSVSLFIPGDVKLTLEGNKYGLYMFEANHQCISTATLTDAQGNSRTWETQRESARMRCDPYRFLFRIQQRCAWYAEQGYTVSWTVDHSVNGGPFLRIVDTPNACTLVYKPFMHNEWIKTEKENPPIIGFPVENHYR